jgi:hypothetical protein
LSQSFDAFIKILENEGLGATQHFGIVDVVLVFIRIRSNASCFRSDELVLNSNLLDILEAEFGKFEDVGGLHGGTETSWVGSDVSEMVIISKFAGFLETSGDLAHFLEAGLDVSSMPIDNHADLLFIVNPDECLLVVADEQSFSVIATLRNSTSCKTFVLFAENTLLKLVSGDRISEIKLFQVISFLIEDHLIITHA